MHDGQKRIRFVDGLRGLSISLVVVWHLYGPTYQNLLPYGKTYADWPIIGQGWVGVQMFFLISGFVIFLTLERCTSLGSFLIRRFTRLFPAMLITSFFLFVFHHLTDLPAPAGKPAIADLLSSLTFIPPSFYHAVFRVDVRMLDDVYWTLQVEVAFYLIFGYLYFKVGWQRAILGLLMVALAARTARPIGALLEVPPPFLRVVEPFEWFHVDQFVWFASGAVFAKSWETNNSRLFLAGAIIAIAAALILQLPVHINWPARCALIVVAISFTVAQRSAIIRNMLTWRPLMFVGFISYPLYLLHNYIGVMLTNLIAKMLPNLGSFMMPLPAIIVVGILSWLVARYAEPALMRIVKGYLLRA